MVTLYAREKCHLAKVSITMASEVQRSMLGIFYSLLKTIYASNQVAAVHQ